MAEQGQTTALAELGGPGGIEPEPDRMGPEPTESGQLIRLALEQGTPVEALERLFALHERAMDRSAEEAMAEALQAFQAECPPIPRTKTAEVKKDGRKQYEYHYAPLDEIVRVIRPVLHQHGLSFTHDGEVTDQGVCITCTLQHTAGARKTATFRGPVDTSGGKNPIQQVASARSYGRRYSLIDVLGLTTEEDDDGRGTAPPPKTVSTKQLADLRALIEEVGGDSEQKILQWAGIDNLADLPASRYTNAVKALENRRNG